MRRRRSEPTAVGPVVGRLLGELGLDGTARVVRIAERWEAAVGPEVAAHCRPTRLRGDVLEANADSSVWCHALQMRRREILDALRRELGEQAPRDLWLRVG